MKYEDLTPIQKKAFHVMTDSLSDHPDLIDNFISVRGSGKTTLLKSIDYMFDEFINKHGKLGK